MLSVFSFLVLVAPFQIVLTSKLCKENEWYDVDMIKCRPCTVCENKSWEMAPCTDFMDRFCVDLTKIAITFNTNQDQGGFNNKPHKWHEMEGSPITNRLSKKEVTTVSDFANRWGSVLLIVFGLTFLCVTVAIVLMVMKRTSRWGNDRKTIARARLFSRDRLNTTEYMNNLATLDRRLAMDEILEKRKRAIFEPQLLAENVYSDEVFVDISGIPRNIRDDHEYEELDHRRCLLRLQEQQ